MSESSFADIMSIHFHFQDSGAGSLLARSDSAATVAAEAANNEFLSWYFVCRSADPIASITGSALSSSPLTLPPPSVLSSSQYPLTLATDFWFLLSLSTLSSASFSFAFPLQASGIASVAALLGMVILAILGSLLAIRDRLEDRNTLGSDYESRHEEFMTDQEKVHQLINENGGRMKQSRIVESVDWSKAKVSRLLAELEDDDQITKLRLGRENLVCLPGHEPTASKSPDQSNE